MLKNKLIMTILLLSNFTISLSVCKDPENGINVKSDTASAKNENIDDMFDPTTPDNLTKPKYENPSGFMVFLRKWGIKFLHKYYEFKQWLIGKNK